MRRLCLCFLMIVLLLVLVGCPELFEKPIADITEGFVLVLGGTFIMGDEFGDLKDESRPVHSVTLTYDFWLAKHPVTFDEYDSFSDYYGRARPYDEGWGRGTRPVIYVSWWSAIAYCNWLSEKEGLAVAYRLKGEPDEGQMLDAHGEVTVDITEVAGYRLPTSAEWEYAARGGKHHSTYKYSGSNDVDEVAWHSYNSGKRTQEVGKLLPNALGIFDMSGNVWEWCSDWQYSYTNEPQTNPYNHIIGKYRIVRGGSWRSSVVYPSGEITGPRVANFHQHGPSLAVFYSGFRIARTVH